LNINRGTSAARWDTAPYRAQKSAKSRRFESLNAALRLLTLLNVASRWKVFLRVADWGGEGARSSALFRLIPANTPYSAFLWRGVVFNLKCGAEDSNAGFWMSKRVRETALVRQSPAKSAFARLFVGRFFCGGGLRLRRLPSPSVGFRRLPSHGRWGEEVGVCADYCRIKIMNYQTNFVALLFRRRLRAVYRGLCESGVAATALPPQSKIASKGSYGCRNSQACQWRGFVVKIKDNEKESE
jgi:hypothetical protein